MNAHPDSLPEPDDDLRLETLLSPLKRIELPLETRIANRLAVTAALRSFQAVNRAGRWPWWRRSVSIPLPLAAALVMLAAVSLAANFRGWQEQSSKGIAAPVQHAEGAADVTADARPALSFYETETYLCGIGRVNSESRYAFKD